MRQAATDHARGQRMSILGLLVNIVLALVKLLAGLLGHSYALIADAIESMTDILASAVVWHGLNIASRPADEEHPYGHGRAESLAALIVAMMIIGAGIGIATEAIREIMNPHYGPAPFTLWVLVGVVVVKEALFRRMQQVAAEVESHAVQNDAWHQRSDAITSAAAAVGIAIAVYGQYPAADEWAALVAAAIILYNGYRLTRAPLRDLMDAKPTDLVRKVRAVAEGVDEVSAVEKVLARKSGLRYLVDMHIEVAPEMTVRRAHAVAHEVKQAVCSALPRVLDVLVHVEPADDRDKKNVSAAKMG